MYISENVNFKLFYGILYDPVHMFKKLSIVGKSIVSIVTNLPLYVYSFLCSGNEIMLLRFLYTIHIKI